MKKGVLFAILFVFALMMFSMGNIAAANDDEVVKNIEDLEQAERIDLAYQCLENKIGNLTDDDEEGISEKDCNAMTLEERAFTVMATGACVDELIDDSRSDELCWPKTNCNLKTTAQSIWALNSDGKDTEKAEGWILDQKGVPKDLIWYLQIETSNQSFCEITYGTADGGTERHTTEILENRKVATGAGSCLSVSENEYWLKIDPGCYDNKFEIKCKESSITNLLFKEDDASLTIHVLDEIESTVADGTTIQQIDSLCLFGSDGCDYEGTLWAVMALNNLDHDISAYIPYLITGKSSNLNSFPLPFLYILTGYGEYKTEILSRQINNQYWQFENGRYFDTAMGLLPFQNEEVSEKAAAVEWLFEVQQQDGCWEGGNIRDNSFLLYSLWPETHISIGPDNGEDIPDNAPESCESQGLFCMSGVNCEGTLLSQYSCSLPSKCCDTAPILEYCSDEPNGILCTADEYCSGTERTMEDGACCIGGACKPYAEPKPTPTPSEADTCSDEGGVCETFACGKGYSESGSLTCSNDGICCVEGDEKSSYAWIWILFILIVLIVIGIIYRDRLKQIIEDMQKDKKSIPRPAERRSLGIPGHTRPGISNRPTMARPGTQRPGMSRPSPSQKMPLPSQRPSASKPMPIRPQVRPEMQIRPQPKPVQKSPQELDSVLKKLKEMSK